MRVIVMVTLAGGSRLDLHLNSLLESTEVVDLIKRILLKKENTFPSKEVTVMLSLVLNNG